MWILKVLCVCVCVCVCVCQSYLFMKSEISWSILTLQIVNVFSVCVISQIFHTRSHARGYRWSLVITTASSLLKTSSSLVTMLNRCFLECLIEDNIIWYTIYQCSSECVQKRIRFSMSSSHTHTHTHTCFRLFLFLGGRAGGPVSAMGI